MGVGIFTPDHKLKHIPRVSPTVITEVPRTLIERYDPSRVGITSTRYADSRFTTMDHEGLESKTQKETCLCG